MKPISRNLPPIQTLRWDRSDLPGGHTHWKAPVTQRGLAQALREEPPGGRSLIFSLQSILGRLPATRVEHVSAETFDQLKRSERAMHQTGHLVPMAPNRASSIIPSQGESLARYQQAHGNLDGAGQYSRGVAINTVRSGSGVCNNTNLVTHGLIAGDHEAQLAEHQRQRSQLREFTPFQPQPVSFGVTDGPHALVRIGDPRDPRHAGGVVIADSANELPIVKTWSNSEHQDTFFPRVTTLAGSGASRSLDFTELQQYAAQRPSRAAVDRQLLAEGRPAIGPGLLSETVKQFQAQGTPIFDRVGMPADARVIYQAPDGSQFVPSIGLGAYQDLRAAQAHPAYALLQQINPNQRR